MAISTLIVEWLSHLKSKDYIKPDSSLLDLGPQDLTASYETVLQVARRHMSAEAAQNITNKIYMEEGIDWGISKCQLLFYSIFGISSYRSLDLYDPRADYPFDLNYHVPVFRRFDLVTDFGTSEHIFNIKGFFMSVHRLLKDDGIALHVIPAFGELNHGLFVMCPLLFRMLAEQNGYEILDLRYVDSWDYRCDQQDKTPQDPFNFDALPISSELALTYGRDETKEGRALVRKVSQVMLKSSAMNSSDDFFPKDFLLVCYKKSNSKKFLYPDQYGAGSRNFNMLLAMRKFLSVTDGKSSLLTAIRKYWTSQGFGK